jgi:CBS domain-containing protein
MLVRELMTKPVHTCAERDALDVPARLMRDHACGAIPVMDAERRVVGIVTDRDICLASLRTGRVLREVRVADAMSRPVHGCRPDDALVQAERIMRQRRVRRLPVIDDRGILVGILSLDDLALRAARDSTVFANQVALEEVGHTLACVCKSGGEHLPYCPLYG